MMKIRLQILWFLVMAVCASAKTTAQNDEMVKVEGGSYIPLYGTDSAIVSVEDFLMDVYPVSHADFKQFVKDNPKWRPSNTVAIFAESGYLSNWASDTTIGEKVNPNSPVNSVSWFAAKAYCKAAGKRLPTIDEWEYAAMADEEVPDARQKKEYNQIILDWYEAPKTFEKEIGSTFKNYWGIYDLHGIVWEWTYDFNAVLISGESRKDSNKDAKQFCGSAAVNATDLMNYAAFMRYAFRGSITANYTGKNLGFRCVKDIENQKTP